MLWFCCWMMALSNNETGLQAGTSGMKPPTWSAGFWGPDARDARLAGKLPPPPRSPVMSRWNRWGREVLREGDIVFRLGDARALHGAFPLSSFIARATGSPFSHTGIIAIEDGSPLVYDCSSDGIRLMPFEVWMLDCVGALGVRRLKPEHRRHIPGVIGYCREVFERQVPFDYEFRLDDAAFYCLELTEKAFRSQGLRLSQPVRIGDWDHLTRYPVTAFAMPPATKFVLGRPITLDQPVYVPGNERQGLWASPLLETVYGPGPKKDRKAASGPPGGISLRGDLELAVFAVRELRRSYAELPVRWIGNLVLHPRIRLLFAARRPEASRASRNDQRRHESMRIETQVSATAPEGVMTAAATRPGDPTELPASRTTHGPTVPTRAPLRP